MKLIKLNEVNKKKKLSLYLQLLGGDSGDDSWSQCVERGLSVVRWFLRNTIPQGPDEITHTQVMVEARQNKKESKK